MPRQRRDDLTEATRQTILDTARRLMSQHGTAGLSLRAIARELELTAPALYHYFPSLDALITALIIRAFGAMAEALAVASQIEGNYAQKIMALCMAYRQWARDNPIDFQLIYGTPIPGYEAPAEQTIPVARRSGDIFIQLLYGALKSGECVPNPPFDRPPDIMRNYLHSILPDSKDDPYALMAVYLMASGWVQIHGAVMLELFGHLGPVTGDVDLFYRQHVTNMLRALGLSP